MPLTESQRLEAKFADLRPGQETQVGGQVVPPVFGGRRSPDSPPHWADSLRRDFRSSVEAGDWDLAMRLALRIGADAEVRSDSALMVEAAWSLVRLELYGRAFELFGVALQDKHGREWTGDDLSGRSLFIDPRRGDIAKFLFWAPLVGDVLTRAKRCSVLVDPRIAPLYRRTFPSIDLVTAEHKDAAQSAADVLTSLEGMARYIWRTGPSQTHKLLADPRLTAEFRERYRSRGPAPFIGVSWGSLNRNKSKPDLGAWRNLLVNTPGTFVSLQYGETRPALAELGEDVAARMIVDDSVDQMQDIDRSAAQVASTDSVISISNTGTHLASALGVRTIVILGDEFYLVWPTVGTRTLWYSNTIIVRRRHRNWTEVMDEVGIRFRDLLGLRAEGKRQAFSAPALEGIAGG
jgi:hypothetical protein